ncbi:DUF4177 domain-containing protein [Paracoccus sp. p3-h83]|uniref:DUF4177 domain-containing protein n=1 Tax=Paracoccus sp. p3-h83 TaxID=3342805 RepID=UPI0035B931B8
MIRYEYRAIPAPARGDKSGGHRSTADRFAFAIETVLNQMGQDGWDYLRADTLPCEERSGLTGRQTQFHNLLIFRRALPVPGDVAADAHTDRLPDALAVLTAGTATQPDTTAPIQPPHPTEPPKGHDYDPDRPVPAGERFFDAEDAPLQLDPQNRTDQPKP